MQSHFKFSKQQRNGIFLLLLIIIGLQCLYFFVLPKIVKSTPSEDIANKEAIDLFQKEIDSLRIIETENRKPKTFPFNPNFITDYKGATLGMTNEEIDRLLNYRKQNQWINSTKQFQEVTKVPDSLLNIIAPYFKFPEWVVNPKPKSKFNYHYSNTPKTFSQKQDLNKATAQQLQKVNGIGEAFSLRIVKFRSKFIGGFIADVQLQDVYGLTPETIEKITSDFTVKTPRPITKIKLNTAALEDLVTIQHIDYDMAHNIIEQRQLREEYKSLDELTKVKGFPVNKIDIIKLYLSLD